MFCKSKMQPLYSRFNLAAKQRCQIVLAGLLDWAVVTLSVCNCNYSLHYEQLNKHTLKNMLCYGASSRYRAILIIITDTSYKFRNPRVFKPVIKLFKIPRGNCRLRRRQKETKTGGGGSLHQSPDVQQNNSPSLTPMAQP